MEKKFELLKDFQKEYNGLTLYRIRALRDIPSLRIKKGMMGGYLEEEHNLAHEGDAWISMEALACKRARIFGDVHVMHDAILENTKIGGEVVVSGEVHLIDSYIDAKRSLIADQVTIRDAYLVGVDIEITGTAFIDNIVCHLPVHEFVMNGQAQITNTAGNRTILQGKHIRFLEHASIADVKKIAGEDILIQHHASLRNRCEVRGIAIALEGNAVVENHVTLLGGIRVSDFAHVYNSQTSYCGIQQMDFLGEVEIDINELPTF